MITRAKAKYDISPTILGLTPNKTYTLISGRIAQGGAEYWFLSNDFGEEKEYWREYFLYPYEVEEDSLEVQLLIINKEIKDPQLIIPLWSK